jgi:hypothetical protein
VEAVGVTGIDSQNLPEEPLGFIEAPSLMMLKRGSPVMLNPRCRGLDYRPARFRFCSALFAIYACCLKAA